METYNNRQSNPTLKEGDSNNYVVILQSKLKELGYYDHSITGSFDLYTKDAVINFQKSNDITPSGIVDSNTWRVLYELTDIPSPQNGTEDRPVLRPSSTGPYVTELQRLLTNLLYYTGTIDGIFGAGTETAVKTFQVNNNLTPDGIVGRDTWSALSSLYSPLAICNSEEGTITYTVVQGDTLWALARRFNTTVAEIKRLNNLTSDNLSIGQKLIIPNGTPSNTITYTVVAGDTLWALARRFNTTVAEIKRLNNLTSDNLSIGQKLIIPNNTPNVTTYTVVRGDTLWSIARRFNTTVNAIKSLNNLTSNNLNIGQQLLIP